VSALTGCLILYALQAIVAAFADVGHGDRGRRRVETRADRPLRRAA
jgi:hypothetical protein